jgi:hypothetical protein
MSQGWETAVAELEIGIELGWVVVVCMVFSFYHFHCILHTKKTPLPLGRSFTVHVDR